MSMVVYGLVPRLITAWIGAIGRARVERWTLLHLPGVDDVLDRLTRWDVRTQAEAPEAMPSEQEAAHEARVDPASLEGPAVLVQWSMAASDAADFALRAELGLDVRERLAAGAGYALAHDERVADEVARALAGMQRGRVAVLVKAWEPATMEAMDFLTALRRRVGDAVGIVVVALRLQPLGAHDTDDRDVAQWRRRCTALGDPWLRVVGIDPQVPTQERR